MADFSYNNQNKNVNNFYNGNCCCNKCMQCNPCTQGPQGISGPMGPVGPTRATRDSWHTRSSW